MGIVKFRQIIFLRELIFCRSGVKLTFEAQQTQIWQDKM